MGRILLLGVIVGCGSSPKSQPPPAAPTSEGRPSENSANSSTTKGAPSEIEVLPEHLTADNIAPVLARESPRVKAQCWQPALDEREDYALTTARVVVHVVVDPSGTVTSAEASDAGRYYPRLSSCVAEVVRSMKFPQAAKPTAVNIPFVFAAQDNQTGVYQ